MTAKKSTTPKTPAKQMTENILFLQSEIKNPYDIYSRMRRETPVYYDALNKIWGVYLYEDCLTVLQNSDTLIPASAIKGDTTIRSISQPLVRLSNPPQHTNLRAITNQLFSTLRPVPITNLLHDLIGEPKRPAEIDWVKTVGKKLTVFSLLKGFGFSPAQTELILYRIDDLVKIMLPSRTTEQDTILLSAIWEVLPPIENRISTLMPEINTKMKEILVANMIGLLIQSYDAGRGLLSNSLFHILKTKTFGSRIEKAVKEVLRYDSPVQNTRRAVKQAFKLGNKMLEPGDEVLVVLASANRDENKFYRPSSFDPDRKEAGQYLSYGSGIHKCIAEHISTSLTSSAIEYLFSKYKTIQLLESEIEYEPRINVRLPVRMRILIS